MQLTDDLLYFWLGISGINARRLHALLSVYTPYELWEQIGKELCDAQVFGEKTYDTLLRYRNEDFLQKSIDKLDNMDISYITYNRFPELLAQKEVHPPAMLYYRGDIALLKSDCIGIVGTRACSPYGKEVATRLATDLCNYNVTVVSGLATGVDGYAHRAALKAKGKTIAVLGSGLHCVTPVSHMGLYEEIVASGGLVISEYAPRYEATKYTFPERNRIISGVSLGVVVVEAGAKSGALITADFAMEQNRTVFAVPGNITSSKSVGTNLLLYDGAVPALNAEDICENVNIACAQSKKNIRAIQLDIFEQKIYNILISGEETYDALVEKAEMPPPKLSALLLSMELKGAIKKKQSNIYCLA